MARLVIAGGEVRGSLTTGATDTFPDGTSVGAQALGILDNTAVSPNPQPRSGSAHWKALRNTGGTCMIRIGFTGAVATSYFARMYPTLTTDLTSLPEVGDAILAFTTSGSTTPLAGVKIDSIDASGNVTVGLYVGSTLATKIGSSSDSFNIATYKPRIELRINISSSAGADDAAELQVNGVLVASTSTATIATTAPGGILVGFVLATGTHGATLYFDDVGVNDSTGTAQNTWCGSGKISLFLPISDSAVGTGWTLGTGTAIAANSGSTAVKNTPPLGVADLAVGSDPKQIRNASANANVNYDANMTSYSTGGVGASDRVRVVQPIIATAAPVTTSAKAGTVGIASNPTVANIALGAGGTAGAFWSGVAAGAYPTGWKWSYGTTTYDPTVVKGTSPVMRVTQVTSSTRIAMVSFMGIYVEYSPASLVAPTSQHQRKVSHRRVAASYDRW